MADFSNLKPSGACPPTILFVEDDAGIRETTADLLSFINATVLTAVSGREASKILDTTPVDLVITDLSMPDGDGNWLLAWIRASPRHEKTKVVIISAHAQRESVEAGLKAGADGYLTKPFNPADFIKSVEKFLAAPTDGAQSA